MQRSLGKCDYRENTFIQTGSIRKLINPEKCRNIENETGIRNPIFNYSFLKVYFKYIQAMNITITSVMGNAIHTPVT